MTRDEIYDHLAQVYLGKRKKADVKNKRQFSAWLLINLIISGIIFASVFYGLTAFLSQKKNFFRNNVFVALHNGSIRLEYNFKDASIPQKNFSLLIPEIDSSKYSDMSFSIRGKEEGTPGVVKVVLRNVRNEEDFFYVRDVGLDWKKVKIPLESFKRISDFSSLSEVSFVLESWNVDTRKGEVLIEDVQFSGQGLSENM